MAFYPYPLEDAPVGSKFKVTLKNTSNTNSYSSTTTRFLNDNHEATWQLSSYNNKKKSFPLKEKGYNQLMFEINYLDEDSTATLEFKLGNQRTRRQELPNNGRSTHHVAISFVTT